MTESTRGRWHLGTANRAMCPVNLAVAVGLLLGCVTLSLLKSPTGEPGTTPGALIFPVWFVVLGYIAAIVAGVASVAGWQGDNTSAPVGTQAVFTAVVALEALVAFVAFIMLTCDVVLDFQVMCNNQCGHTLTDRCEVDACAAGVKTFMCGVVALVTLVLCSVVHVAVGELRSRMRGDHSHQPLLR
eukprot:GFYU01000814.1.p1 GENE.GFYU01000814.1~~GFYU01000814.1.p1  ORF type:complete len:186 (+),score=46.23 GFYU01000814.1:100-657(+)